MEIQLSVAHLIFPTSFSMRIAETLHVQMYHPLFLKYV
jgi:hypothetical protein